jgi:hypothetical protein
MEFAKTTIPAKERLSCLAIKATSRNRCSTLHEDGVQLVTKLKTNMKNRLISMFDKIMLRKRAIIESVVDQLKNISQIEHSRHRSVANCFVNLLAGLIAYTWREKKPSLNIRVKEQLQLPSLII